MSTIIDEIKRSFKEGGMLTKLIYINLAVFIVVNLLDLAFLFGLGRFGDTVVRYLSTPPAINDLLRRPWTLISYMFLHKDFFHVLWNLLILYWFGQIFLRYLNEKQMLAVYILGGISGASLFILVYNMSPAFTEALPYSILLGASASVMAIVTAISFYSPNFEMNLMFIGPVKLKYLALVYLGLDILQIAGANPGGHLAHLGGALFGYYFVSRLKKGKDISAGFNKFMESIVGLFKPRKHITVSYKNSKNARKMADRDYNKSKAETQEEVDRILDKIAKAGYDSLTKREKEILFKMSNKG